LSTTIGTDDIHRTQIAHRQFSGEWSVSNRKNSWCRKSLLKIIL
jgi:hypothetical protein